MTIEPPGPSERRLRERMLDLVERHGDDYLVEGKRLLRRLRRTIVIVGVVAVAALVVMTVLVGYAVLW